MRSFGRSFGVRRLRSFGMLVSFHRYLRYGVRECVLLVIPCWCTQLSFRRYARERTAAPCRYLLFGARECVPLVIPCWYAQLVFRRYARERSATPLVLVSALGLSRSRECVLSANPCRCSCASSISISRYVRECVLTAAWCS